MKFPCVVCGKEYPNTFQMNKCARSGTCKPLHEEKEVSSANRPKYEFPFENAKSSSIEKYQWEKHGIDGAHHSMGGLGSLGVFLLNLKNDAGVIVMKQGAISSAAECFCSLLYRDLKLAAPAIRVLNEVEYKKIVAQLGDVSFTTPGAGDHLQSRAGQRGAMLMEFGAGVTLKHPSIKDILGNADKAKQLLQGFGKLIAVDMLVNNFDRSPAIWTHEGNANNILIQDTGGEVIVTAIDQAITPIVNEQYGDDRIGVYVDNVTKMCEEAVDRNIDGPCSKKILKFWKQYTDHDIGDAGLRDVHEGIVETCIVIGLYHNFASLHSQATSMFTEAGWGTPGLVSLNISFLERVANAIAESVAKVKNDSAEDSKKSQDANEKVEDTTKRGASIKEAPPKDDETQNPVEQTNSSVHSSSEKYENKKEKEKQSRGGFCCYGDSDSD